ncbi:MAG TPA: VanZ family protein [Gammaproteobacteria bacterium]
MLPLRYPWLWMAFGWGLVAAVTVGSLVPSGLIRGISLSDKLMHAGSYCLLMIWFAGLYARRRHVLIAAVLLMLGLVLEILQHRTSYRMFDLTDMLANAVGVAAGFVVSFFVLEGWCQRLEKRLLFDD